MVTICNGSSTRADDISFSFYTNTILVNVLMSIIFSNGKWNARYVLQTSEICQKSNSM